MLRKCSLKVGCLNINGGLLAKCRSPDILNLVQQHDIFCFVESWLSPNDACPKIHGYNSFRSDRMSKHKNARSHSGGILIYFKNNISGGLAKLDNKHSDMLWFKLDKYFFGLERDLYMCVIYMTPETSSRDSDLDIFNVISNDIEKYALLGNVSLIGDLNSRVAGRQPLQYEIDPQNQATDLVESIEIPERISQDKRVNNYGRKLLQTLTNYDLLIANGCTIGDLSGSFTCEQYSGSSVVDMFIAHRDFLPRMAYFKVGEFDWFSDHAPISVSFAVDINKDTNMPRYWRKVNKLFQNWNSETKAKFIDKLSSSNIQSRLTHFCETDFDDSNIITTQFTDIVKDVIHSVFPKKRRKRDIIQKNRVNYSHECELAKRAFKKAQRAFKNDKNNLNRRQIYLREKKKYKRIVNKTTKLVTENRIHQLASIQNSDSKTFWKRIKDMTNPKDDTIRNIDPNEWTNHFQNLLKTPRARGTNVHFRDYVEECLPILERVSEKSNILNIEITSDEIKSTVRGLKIGKSTFLDDISNDAIKEGLCFLDDSLTHLYNTVLRCGTFPDLWGESLIIPLHKKGDKMNVNNYRGIMISSSVGKIFLKILTKRIDNFMKTNEKWCLNQCGFKEDHRTEDNLFILQTIYNSHVENNKGKIFIAFVDFSKFFDKIDRKFLRYKLLRYGITGKIYDVLKSMYSKTSYRVNVSDCVSPSFEGKNGVKQGCVISPLLSNIFQNDLHDIFRENSCDPIILGDITLSSISWADDLILISKSQKGLQKCLDNLNEYCCKWGLEVNIDKTKVMVLSKRSHKAVELYYGQNILECVKKFNYLGFLITNNCKFTHLIHDRVMKANRVSNLVLQAFRTSGNINVSLSLNIFDRQILPILLYGSSIWSLSKTQNYIYINGQTENGNTRSIVKDFFKSFCDKDIQFISARRVGRKQNSMPRNILVKLKTYDDKEFLLRQNPNFITNFESKTPHKVERVHTSFCKRSLNVNKYASTTGVIDELARYPIIHNAHALAVKYWLRLKSGTKNKLLNEAYKITQNENHEWYQSIQYILCSNGFRNIWLDSTQVNVDNFHKTFKKRLNDQYEQNILSKLRDSERLSILAKLKSDFSRSEYLEKIRNPDIRKTFTRLRIDLNILNTCKFRQRKMISPRCTYCEGADEDVIHFLLHCTKFADMRNIFMQRMRAEYSNFSNISDLQKLKIILNLDCPTSIEPIVCNFVKNLYFAREMI